MTQRPDSFLKNPPNFNILWGALVVEELVRNGVDRFFLSPGSRSSPVTLAVADNPRTKSVVHFDERAAAYAALGAAKATGRPAAVVCTSGTAVANFFPAVVEAAMAFVPLILITADRPHELLDAGANQTIEQADFFGKYARWFVNLPCPYPQVPGRTLLTAVDQAVYRACSPPAGPVQINMMFREPLAPISMGEPVREAVSHLAAWDATDRPYTAYELSETVPAPETIRRVHEIVKGASHGILVVGQMALPAVSEAILQLVRELKWPVFPDITSGLRLGPDSAPFAHYYDQLFFSDSFREFCRPDAVIQLGSPFVSSRLQRHLLSCKPAHYVLVANHPHRHDPAHLATMRLQSGAGVFCTLLAESLRTSPAPEPDLEWLNTIQRYNAQCRQAFNEVCGAGGPPAHISEPDLACILPSLLPGDATLFLSSSMPIRDADMYADPMEKPIFATASRGASGIDGLVATAAGYAYASGRPLVLVLGDLALLHDLNSLALVAKLELPMTIIVTNNFGGAIFSFLPIAAFPDHFEKFWAAPHAFTFGHAAKMFGVSYANPSTMEEFAAAVRDATGSGAPALIEINNDREENAKKHRAIQEHIRKTLDRKMGTEP